VVQRAISFTNDIAFNEATNYEFPGACSVTKLILELQQAATVHYPKQPSGTAPGHQSTTTNNIS
jgi:hypothetical protein